MNPFKDNLDSIIAGVSIKEGLLSVANFQTTVIPVSDGGDGFLEVIKSVEATREMEVATVNAIGEPLRAPIVLSADGERAFIEVAKANGLGQCSHVDFANSNSYGVGLLIKHALQEGAKDITIGVGGTASADMGLGLLQALGLRVLDTQNNDIRVTTGTLGSIATIDSSLLATNLAGVSIRCWVDGSSQVDGSDGCWERALNKGGSESDKAQLKQDIERLIRLIEATTDKQVGSKDLLGCGGAIAAGLYAFANASVELGAEQILDLINADRIIDEHDLIVSGEGIVDHTTFLDKLPGRLLKRCQARHKPLILVSSKSTMQFDELHKRGVMSFIRTDLDNYTLALIKSQNISKKLLFDSGTNLGKMLQ